MIKKLYDNFSCRISNMRFEFIDDPILFYEFVNEFFYEIRENTVAVELLRDFLSDISIVDVVINNNHSRFGGGIYIGSSQADIENSIISNKANRPRYPLWLQVSQPFPRKNVRCATSS